MPKDPSSRRLPKEKSYLPFPSNISGPIVSPSGNEILRKWLLKNKDSRAYQIGNVISNSGRVSTARDAWPVVGSRSAYRRLKGAPGLVAKFVNLQHKKYTSGSSREYSERQMEAAQREIGHISSRLRNCPHANPIFDLTVDRDPDSGILVPVTMQLKLHNCLQLDDWLYQFGLRSARRQNVADTLDDTSGWTGIKSIRDWASISLAIAHALHSIHLHRTVHGDVHPGNIFLTNHEVNPEVIFIDFAESFLVLDTSGSRDRTLHSYLAPECQARVSRRNDSIDRYSFGMLLIYLASGVEMVLDAATAQNDRKQAIEKMIDRNGTNELIRNEPRILDLINKCVVQFPGDRLSLSEACSQLHRIFEDASGDNWEPACCPFLSYRIPKTPSINRVKSLLDASLDDNFRVHPVVKQLVAHQLFEIEEMLHGLRTDMFQIYSTRDRVLRALISVVDELKDGDSWTSATTLDLWHGRGLGLEGSYHTSMVRAVRRKVNVRRVFILTAEDLGCECITMLAEGLFQAGEASTAKKWLSAALDWESELRTSGNTENPATIKWYRERFKRLLAFLMAQPEPLEGQWKSGGGDVWNAKGFCVSIQVVSSRREAEGLKSQNPAALLCLTQQDEFQKWLLVTAETHLTFDKDKAINRQHLVGARIYSSAMENRYPHDRIVYLKSLFNDSFPLNHEFCHTLLSVMDNRVPSNDSLETFSLLRSKPEVRGK